MKTLVSRLPKKALVLALSALTVVGVAAAASAWSPDRPTYTTAHPADHVTFNSITDNPREGDERAFFEVKDAANTASDGFAHKAVVHDGEEVLLRVYVHNNAADNLNGTNFDGPGVAKNTQVRVWLPSVTDSVMRANAYVSADNAQPQTVSDTVDLGGATTNDKFSISYVPGSAVAYNNAVGQTGMKLNDSIVTTGAKIGYQQADGIVPGCFQYVNVITLKVKVHMQTPTFTVEKKVALMNDKTWSKSVTANPGDTVKYQIGFKNTGNTTLENVVVRDLLPKGETLVAGSTKLYNANFPSGSNAGTDAVTSNGGLGIGAYTAGSNAYVSFQATLPKEDALECGTNKLTNTAQVITGGVDSTDTADVTVNKTCANVTPMQSCDLLDVTQGDNQTVTVKDFKYTAKNGATFKNVVLSWGDASTDLTTNNVIGQQHQYSGNGPFTIKAVAHFDVNGKDVTDSGAACSKVVNFTTPTTPTQLPNTGAGDVIGIFGAATVLGAVAYRLFLGRKLVRL